ncbi:MAG: hypothetical protein AAF267_23295 [Deinococcota bacterium]
MFWGSVAMIISGLVASLGYGAWRWNKRRLEDMRRQQEESDRG